MRNLSKNLGVSAMAVFLACLSAFTPTAWAKYNGGTGEPNDPYRIATPQDLNDIGNYQEDWDKHFILVNDINLAEYTGTQFKIIGRFIKSNDPNNKPFRGVFDGNGHKILNFTWSSFGRRGFGLFGFARGQIKNLGMENVNVIAVGGEYVGGLVGLNEGTITGCHSSGSVEGWHNVGGLVGAHSTSGFPPPWPPPTISACYSTGSVTGNGDCVGGLVGLNCCVITNCYSTGRVSGGSISGGLIGGNGGTVFNCYSTGSVSQGSYVGGLVAMNVTCIISSCYASGSIVGTGWSIIDSFWDIETSGQSTSAGGTPKTTAEMKTMSTFTNAGWDFIEIWGIGENQTYPYLRTEPAGDSNHDKKVDLLDLAIFASHWLEENQ